MLEKLPYPCTGYELFCEFANIRKFAESGFYDDRKKTRSVFLHTNIQSLSWKKLMFFYKAHIFLSILYSVHSDNAEFMFL